MHAVGRNPVLRAVGTQERVRRLSDKMNLTYSLFPIVECGMAPLPILEWPNVVWGLRNLKMLKFLHVQAPRNL